MTVWVNQTRPGWPKGDGNSVGYPTMEAALAAIEQKRMWRDTSPVYSAFKAQNIDWVVSHV